jgi:hypothetical protein
MSLFVTTFVFLMGLLFKVWRCFKFIFPLPPPPFTFSRGVCDGGGLLGHSWKESAESVRDRCRHQFLCAPFR